MEKKIELVLLTGFLGSGKTTLLNKLAAHYSSRKIGILVNDFGKLPVDGSLIKGEKTGADESASRIYEISNGSIFCSCLTASFVFGLKYFIREKPDILFIETSGLSDPSGLRRLLMDFSLFDQFIIRETICVLDAVRVPALRATLLVIDKQISSADFILINKSDLADKGSLEGLKKAVFELNPEAEIELVTYCDFDFNRIENISVLEKNGNLQSCNTPETRQADTLLMQKEVVKTRLLEFLKDIEKKVLRLKGYFMIDNQLHFITDNSGTISMVEAEQREDIRTGISLICFTEDLGEIEEKWKHL